MNETEPPLDSDLELRHSFVIRHSPFVIPIVPDAPPNPELLRSLGRLVRGLSALFWGLPIALLVSFYTAKTDELRSYNVAPAMAATGLLVFGVWQLGDFQKQERIWRHAFDRGLILSL